MTTLTLLPAPTGRSLRPVPAGEPLATDATPAQLLAHAQRVHRLLAEHEAQTQRLTKNYPTSALMGDLPTGWHLIPHFGIALSWAVDLGAIPAKQSAIAAAAFPAGNAHLRAREAVNADVPRYKPSHRWDRACPWPGPRGGKCRTRPRQRMPVVTDPATGDYHWREVCAAHADRARAEYAAAPTPVPNRGGILAAVFPEWDIDALYRWVDDRWRGDATGMPLPPAELRVVRGGRG